MEFIYPPLLDLLKQVGPTLCPCYSYIYLLLEAPPFIHPHPHIHFPKMMIAKILALN